MSFEKAKEYLSKYNLEDHVMTFDVSSRTVAEAATAIGCQEGEIAKTLSFIVEDKPILIVVSGASRIDNSKYKAEFHTKAKMVPYEQVESLIGHAAGGVCPFGIKDDIDVYLDESIKKYDIIYPACGNAQSAVKLTLKELEKIANSKKWIDVCKKAE